MEFQTGSRAEIPTRNGFFTGQNHEILGQLREPEFIEPECIAVQIPSCLSLAIFQNLWIFVVLTSCLAADQAIDRRIPSEVLHNVAYVNPAPPPLNFNSALLWGIAIADIRVPGFENADVKVAWTQLSCSSSSKTVILNDDYGEVRGGLYRRFPWFGADRHEPMPIMHSLDTNFQPKKVSVLRVGQRPDRVWHFWSASPRARLLRKTLRVHC